MANRVNAIGGSGASPAPSCVTRWKAALQPFSSDQHFLQLVAALFLLLHFRDLNSTSYPAPARLLGITLIFSAIAFPRLLSHPGYWFLHLIPNSWLILQAPYSASNHAHVELYVILTFLINSRIVGYQRRLLHLQSITRWLIFCIMFFAVIHKLQSEEFRSGAFFYYRWLTGGLLPPWQVSTFIDDFLRIAAQNQQAMSDYMAAPQSPGVPLVLRSPGNYQGVFQGLAIGVLLAESAIAVLCLFPKLAKLRNAVLLPFIVGTAVSAPEVTFLSLLGLLGLILCRSEEWLARLGYIGVIIGLNALGYAFFYLVGV